MKHLRLKNPYTLDSGLTWFLRFYRKYPDSPNVNKPLRYIYYLLHLVARVWGFVRLKNGFHNYFLVSCNNGFRFRARATNSQFHSIYFSQYRQVYEPDVTSVLETFLNKGDVFVDVGSNWGHLSYYAILEKNASVIAFEPNPLVAEDIRRIAEEIGVNEKIQIKQVGLSDAMGRLKLEQHYFESGVASIDKTFSDQYKQEKYISLLHRMFGLKPIVNEVDILPLDSMGLKKIKLIKVDAEGAEILILNGARNSLLKLRPLVCFEFHSGDLSNFDNYKTFFSSVNYDMYEILVSKDPFSTDLYSVEFISTDSSLLVSNKQYNLLAAPSECQINM